MAHNRLHLKLEIRSHLEVPTQIGLKLKGHGQLPNPQLYPREREPLNQVPQQIIHNLDFEALGLEHRILISPRQQDLRELLMHQHTS